MNHIFWKGYCNHDRTKAISDLSEIVNSFGQIVDSKFYSDFVIVLQIDLPETNIVELFKALKVFMSINESNVQPSTSTLERTIFLNVSFIRGTGNLTVEVPSVPG